MADETHDRLAPERRRRPLLRFVALPDGLAATAVFFRGAFDKFINRYLELVSQVRVGDPSSPSTGVEKPPPHP